MKYEDYAKIRDSKGFSDAKVAREAGIGQSTFSDWKSGRSVPKDEKMIKIANALEITVYELRTGEKPNLVDKLAHIVAQETEEDSFIESYKQLSVEEQKRVVEVFKLMFPDKF